MRFEVFRTSRTGRYGPTPPCEGAELLFVEEGDDPIDEKSHFWAIEIEDLPAFVAFMEAQGGSVVFSKSRTANIFWLSKEQEALLPPLTIEIYDTYRE